MTMTDDLLHDLRVDHTGSFLRPEWLKDAYRRHGLDQVSDAELTAAQDRAVQEVIRRQEALSFPILSDGEMRRMSFRDTFATSVSGFAPSETTIQVHEERETSNQSGPGPRSPFSLGRVTEPVRLARNRPLDEYRSASALTSRPVKATVLGVGQVAHRVDTRAAYASKQEFIADLTAINHAMVEGLVQAGCPYVQIDAPVYTMYVDEPSLALIRAQGEDPADWLAGDIAADNAVIAGLEDAVLAIHLCRGNRTMLRAGAYDTVAEQLFTTLNHQRFLLEYDDDRAGGFAPLRFLPKGKMAVLGLVSTRRPGLESADELKRRIEEATRYISPAQLALSPQCGFASSILGNPVSEDMQWRKLELIQQVASDVWGG
jgi:5-methyltetrahydropteroyltriglutamate--homocysteine methyltransferase